MNQEERSQQKPEAEETLLPDLPEPDPEPKPERAKVSMPAWMKNPWMLALIPAVGCLAWVTAELVHVQLFSMLEIGLVLGSGLLLIAAAILLLHYLDGKLVRIIGVFLCAIICVCSFNGERRCSEIMVSVQQAARHTDTIHRTLGLYTIREVPLASIQALDHADIGVLGSRSKQDAEAFAKNLLDEDGVSIKQVDYPTMEGLIKALKGQAVRAVFLSSEDISLASALPGMENLKNELTLVQNFSVDTGLKNESIPVNLYSEPFTILVSASSSPLDQESYRSLLTAVVTVNPKTRTALSVFLPRNLKTQYACPPELECISEEDKLGLSSLFSIEALKETVSTLLDTEINYTIRVDLETLVSMMDYEDPVQVSNKTEYSSGNYTFKEGELEMNPAMARAYYRELNDFSAADNDYQYNPGALLDAVVEKLRSSVSLKDVKSLEELSKAVHTNMSYSQLCGFLRMFCLHPISCELLETEVTGTAQWQNSTVLCAPANMVEADPSSLEEVRSAIASLKEGNLPDLSADLSDEVQTEETDGEKQEEKPLDEDEEQNQQEQETQDDPQSEEPLSPEVPETPVWEEPVPQEDPNDPAWNEPGWDDGSDWSDEAWQDPSAWEQDASQETGW